MLRWEEEWSTAGRRPCGAAGGNESGAVWEAMKALGTAHGRPSGPKHSTDGIEVG